jgi:hypothetical protein
LKDKYMKTIVCLTPFGLFLSLLLAGCSEHPGHEYKAAAATNAASAPDEEAAIRKAFAGLSPEDRKLAEAQKFCVVEEENRLGSMSVPVKLEINGQTVFLCCKGCKATALKDPDKTLAKVKELKEKNAAKPPENFHTTIATKVKDLKEKNAAKPAK